MTKLEKLKNVELSEYVTNITKTGMLIFIGMAVYNFLYLIIVKPNGLIYSLEMLFMPSIFIFVIGGLISLVFSFLTYPLFKLLLRIVVR